MSRVKVRLNPDGRCPAPVTPPCLDGQLLLSDVDEEARLVQAIRPRHVDRRPVVRTEVRGSGLREDREVVGGNHAALGEDAPQGRPHGEAQVGRSLDVGGLGGPQLDRHLAGAAGVQLRSVELPLALAVGLLDFADEELVDCERAGGQAVLPVHADMHRREVLAMNGRGGILGVRRQGEGEEDGDEGRQGSIHTDTPAPCRAAKL